jgi:hypothetical protein
VDHGFDFEAAKHSMFQALEVGSANVKWIETHFDEIEQFLEQVFANNR